MLAILSDVHANLEALQAVLTDARDHGAATCISLGDHIGFNGDPAACLDLLIPRLSAAVQGNHEAELLHPGTLGVPLYEHMMQRTAAMLSPWHMDWLAQLPLTRSYGSLHLLHAPTDGHRWKRISTPSQAAALLRSQPQPLFLTGHTHRPAVFTQRGSTTTQVPLCYDATGTCKLTLETTARYLINPGSVGQPRDGDPRAAYGLLSLPDHTLILRRVPYDTQTAAAKIARTGLPATFSQALLHGSSPTGD